MGGIVQVTVNSLKSLQILVAKCNEILSVWLFVDVYFGNVARHFLILQNRWSSYPTKSYHVIAFYIDNFFLHVRQPRVLAIQQKVENSHGLHSLTR